VGPRARSRNAVTERLRLPPEGGQAAESGAIIGGSETYYSQGYADGRARVELSRLLARSLAHELGHSLLGTPSHTEDGLMRRRFGPWDARTTDMSPFALDVHQLDALDRTVAAWRRGSLRQPLRQFR